MSRDGESGPARDRSGDARGGARRGAPEVTARALAIYFSGSISGGREDRGLYRRLIRHLGRQGRVLTEHLGDEDLTATGEVGLGDAEIFARDLRWLADADVVIAEVTTPSLGVGYEVARAEALGKPILCLHRPAPGRRLSAMIAGCPGVTVRAYEDWASLVAVVDGFLGDRVRGG